MKKNAFTLVELLAVILILAIIALIVVPQVINLINSSKEQSNEIGIQNYVRAIETAVMNKDLDMEVKNLNGEYTIINNGKKIQSSDNIIDIGYDGKEITLGKVRIKDYKVIALGVEQDNKYIIYENGKIIYNGEKQSPVSFSEDSWETISLNVKVGNLSKYKVGDTREIELKGFENGETDENGVQIKTYTIRIANKTNTGDVCTKEYFEKEDGTKETYSKTACGFVIEFEDLILPTGDDAKMNLENINAGGWKDSKMRTYVNNTIYNALPEKLREKIINTTVVSGYGSGDAPNKVTTDKVYLLSPGEVWEQGTSNTIDFDTARENTRQLDYYKDVAKVTTTSYSGAIKKYNGSASSWWLRSARSTDTGNFYGVSYYGYWYYDGATSTRWVAVAFRIG